MTQDTLILIYLGLFIGFIFLVRTFGAWMLRIDEVIKNLKDIKEILKNQPIRDDGNLSVEEKAALYDKKEAKE